MYDLVIIGGGPAGGSAAIFAGRAGKKTLVIDANNSVAKRAHFNNYYGIESITGNDLLKIGKEQAIQAGAEWLEDEAIALKKVSDYIIVSTSSGKQVQAKHVLLATGMAIQLAQAVGAEIIPGREPKLNQIIKVDNSGKTNVEGVWAAGPMAGATMHAIVDAGEGAKVAINIISELNGARHVDHDVVQV